MQKQDAELLLTQLQNLINNQPEANTPAAVSPQLQELENSVMLLTKHLQQNKAFTASISEGRMGDDSPSRDNYLSGGLKAIHSSLMHLTWQTQQIEKGDYGQRVDFMGDFSKAFNNMVDRLIIRERELEIDSLTSVRNKVKFEIDAANILQKSQSGHALVIIDIDKFKVFNDTFGFVMGDQLICYMAQAIDQELEDGEIFGRYVADQFYLLLKHSSNAHTINRVRRLQQHIKRDFKLKHHITYNLEIFSGIYIIPQNLEQRGEDFHAHTNKAMYALNEVQRRKTAKVLIYEESIKQKLVRATAIETKMKNALKQDEFHMYLQPKYGLAQETIVGAEALVRWIDKEHSFIPPMDFIDIFEKNGFMAQIDMHMLEKSCQLIRKWLDEGRDPLPISVNFSRMNLENEHFVRDVNHIARKYNVPACYIEIELTENILFDNVALLVKVTNQLHAYGFKLSMDDFGSGYSSLGLLKDLPIDEIKMDRSFFSDCKDRARSKVVVSSVIALARNLGIDTVAEGVETREHVEILRELGCDIVQGFYFAKPMTVLEFEKKLPCLH